MDIALKIKAKNGILQKFIDSKNWTQADFARAIGVSANDVCAWFNMRDYPRTEDKMFKLCELVGKLPEEIFPPPMMDKDWLMGNREWTIHKEVDIEFLPINSVLLLPAPTGYLDEISKDYVCALIEEANLTKREKSFISNKFGLDEKETLTTKQLSEKFNVCYARANQIEQKCLRKLRHAVGRVSTSDFFKN